MKEILGSNLETAFKELNINAKKTFQTNRSSDFAQVWELSDEDFKKICDIPDGDWKDDWGWWRWSDGSNISWNQTHIIKINGVEINTYYDESNLNEYVEYYLEDEYIAQFDNEDDARNQLVSDYFNEECDYRTFTQYCSEQWGASTEKNVAAIAIETARLNNISLGELFNKYQG